MSEGTSTNTTYNDQYALTGGIDVTYETDATKKIHTRVMVQDAEAAGYVTESATISSGTRFSAIDTETFDAQFSKTYHDSVVSGNFVVDIDSYYDETESELIIVATDDKGNTYEIATGNPADSDFSDTLSDWGISISTYGTLYYKDGDSISSVTIFTESQFSQLYSNAIPWSITIGNVTVSYEDIVGIDMPESVTSIGNYFLGYCPSLNRPLDLSNVTSIGNYFLSGCTSFNQPLDLSNVASIGNYFLQNCTSFNSSLNLSNVTSIGSRFLYQCTSFNQSLDLPNITSIGGYFLYYCTSFNQPLSLSNITSIGTYFLWNCSSFNQSLDLSNVTTIGSSFLRGCTSFNQNITIPATLTSIGTDFMYNCNSMVSTVTCNAPATVISESNYTFATTNSSAACYVTGLYLSGTYCSAWYTKFPESTSSPYRKATILW